MADMFTVSNVQNGIAKSLKRIDELVDEIAKAGDDAAHFEADFKTAYAKARLQIRALAKEKLTVDEVADRAHGLCEAEFLAYKIAENRLTTCREALRASQARLDGLRSLLSSIKVATN